MDKSNG